MTILVLLTVLIVARLGLFDRRLQWQVAPVVRLGANTGAGVAGGYIELSGIVFVLSAALATEMPAASESVPERVGSLAGGTAAQSFGGEYVVSMRHINGRQM
jgi:hypothetical protein